LIVRENHSLFSLFLFLSLVPDWTSAFSRSIAAPFDLFSPSKASALAAAAAAASSSGVYDSTYSSSSRFKAIFLYSFGGTTSSYNQFIGTYVIRMRNYVPKNIKKNAPTNPILFGLTIITEMIKIKK